MDNRARGIHGPLPRDNEATPITVASGRDLPMIGKYAHLAGDPVRAAANDVAEVIASKLGCGLLLGSTAFTTDNCPF